MPVTCDALTPLHPRASGLVVPVGSVASGHRGSAQTAGDGNMPWYLALEKPSAAL